MSCSNHLFAAEAPTKSHHKKNLLSLFLNIWYLGQDEFTPSEGIHFYILIWQFPLTCIFLIILTRFYISCQRIKKKRKGITVACIQTGELQMPITNMQTTGTLMRNVCSSRQQVLLVSKKICLPVTATMKDPLGTSAHFAAALCYNGQKNSLLGESQRMQLAFIASFGSPVPHRCKKKLDSWS